jgi:hypothetical protein
MLAHPSDLPDLAPCECLLFASMKKHLRSKLFKSEDNINTAVTASLHCLSKDKCRAVTDRLPHRWEKLVDNSGDYTVWRT